jgi:hypothetical protein
LKRRQELGPGVRSRGEKTSTGVDARPEGMETAADNQRQRDARATQAGGRGENQKVNEVDLMLCPKCGGMMKVIALITDFQAVDRIIDQIKLTFVAERPPPSRAVSQELLMAADVLAEYFS